MQSELQAAINDSGRLEVAWKTQRVSEGESSTPAIVRYATAAPGHGFGRQRTVETVGAVGTGRYVSAPGVRLVPQLHGRTLLAWTGFVGGHFVVRAADVVDGHRGAPQPLSPASPRTPFSGTPRRGPTAGRSTRSPAGRWSPTRRSAVS